MSTPSIHDLSSAQRYQLLAAQAAEFALIVMDDAGTIVEWSPGAQTLLGWTAQEAIGQPASLIFTEEDRRSGVVRAELHTAQALGCTTDTRWHMRKDGSTVFCDGMANRILADDGHTLLGFGKIVREAYGIRTQDGSASADGATQRSFLAAVLESVDDGVVVCDRQGKITFFNDAAKRIHGLRETPVSFERWAGHYQQYEPDGITLLPFDALPLYRALKGDTVERVDIVVMAQDGVRRHVQVTGRPLQDRAGHLLGAVVAMHDVSGDHEARYVRDEMAREVTRHVAAEESTARLRRAEEQLRLAAQAAELGIWTWDIRHDASSWENARMYEIFNIDCGAEPVNTARLMADYLHPDDVPAYRETLERTIHADARFHFTGRFYRLPARDVRWIELTGVRQPGREREADVIVGTAADITERKSNEEALAQARLRLEATLWAAEVATWIWDIDADRIIADRNLAHLFGLPDELAQGAPLARYATAIHPDDMPTVTAQLQQTIATKVPYRATYRIADRNGGWRWVNARGKVEEDEHGRPKRLAGVTLDITRQVELQQEWHTTEERYRTLITSMDEAFGIVQVIVDDTGKPVDYRFEEVNRALELQSGLEGAAGRTIREMVPGIEPHWIEIYGRVALTREPARFVEHSAAMGYWWDVYATPMGAPEELRIAILFTDITARKQAEENLRRVAADLSEANRRKTEFLATLAHELRNPLAPMRTGLDLIRMTGRTGAGSDKVVDMLDRQMKQMVHLIDDLMDVSRISSGKIVLKREAIDLKEAIRNAAEAVLPAIEAAHHRLDVQIPDDTIMLDADATRLAQILGNLLTNAVKYTPGGGRIMLSARAEDRAAIVKVADTGVGIPLEEQAGVFEMFSQVSRNMGRSQGGLGIGLSLVKSLVEMHGGTIAVESSGAGRGTTFTVVLPALDGDAARQRAVDAADSALPRRSLRVLVADDNVDAANMLSRLLQAAGHTTETVHDGVNAVQKIAAFKPDLAILDIGMPGLDGYQVAEQIRSRPGLERTRLVALTGWGGNHDRTRSEQAGFDAHLTKPAGFDDLNALIARLLDRTDPQQA